MLSHQLPCKIMAILLHFFFLSAFAWMLVEGLHLYSMVVKVFGSEGSKHFYYYGIGWGKPARCPQTSHLLMKTTRDETVQEIYYIYITTTLIIIIIQMNLDQFDLLLSVPQSWPKL